VKEIPHDLNHDLTFHAHTYLGYITLPSWLNGKMGASLETKNWEK
jgi:hypothetical protein